MNDHALNPFRESSPAVVGGATEIATAREAQEVQAMVVVAKRFPRSQVQAMDRILQACTRPGLAETSLYQYSRGGSDITGPSIRLAEAIAQNWSNFQFGFREVGRGQDGRGGFSDVEAYAWDLETNTRKPISFRVRHWRDTKKGGYALTEERDIYELVANQASRRVRNCILSLIPGDVTEAAQRQCEITLKTTANVTPDSIKKMVDAFSEFGVTRQQIETKIQRRLDTITPALMVSMKKIFASLRDGMSVPSDYFEEQKDSITEAALHPEATTAQHQDALATMATEDEVNSYVDRCRIKNRWSVKTPAYSELKALASARIKEISEEVENAGHQREIQTADDFDAGLGESHE